MTGRAKESHQGKGHHPASTGRQEQACPIRDEPLTACKTEPRQPTQAHTAKGTGREERERGPLRQGSASSIDRPTRTGVLNPRRATYDLQHRAVADATQAHVEGARRRVIKARVSIHHAQVDKNRRVPAPRRATYCLQDRVAAADAATWSNQEVEVGKHPKNRRAPPVTSHLRSTAPSRGSRRRHVEQEAR